MSGFNPSKHRPCNQCLACCYDAGHKVGLNNERDISHDYKYQDAYGTGYRHGKQKATLIINNQKGNRK